ncbi:MAG: MFS transporter [Peptococcaceae bacterium]|nr:MFS transporter [Peptococcaceae bacterium]
MKQASSKLWTGQFILALILQMGLAMSFFIYYSTIGIYATKMTSVEVYIGIVTAMYTLASLSTRLFSGNMMKQFTCKRILVTGSALLLAASVGYFFTASIQSLIFVRAIHGLGYGFASAALATLISTMLPKERLLEGLGYAMMLNTICAALGPALSLTLSQSNPEHFMPVFVTALFVSILVMVLSLCMKNRTIPQGDAVMKKTEKTGLFSCFSLATVFAVCITFLLCLNHSSVNACLALYAVDEQFGNLSLFFILFSTANFFSRLFMTKIYQFFTERQVFLGITMLLIVFFFGIGLAPNRFWIFVLAPVFGVVMGLYYPLMAAKILKSMPESEQGTSNNINMGLQDIGATIGAVIWTGMAGVFDSYRIIYLVCALLAIVMLLIVAIYPSVLKRYHVKEEQW